jgi:hypothetical protein
MTAMEELQKCAALLVDLSEQYKESTQMFLSTSLIHKYLALPQT